MRVGRVQQPLDPGVGPVLDHLADELDPETVTAEVRQNVDVGEVREGDPVGDGACEADLAIALEFLAGGSEGSNEYGSGAARVQAANALRQVGGAEARAAVPSLVEMLAASDRNVRLSAVQALGQMGEEAKDAAHDVFIKAFRAWGGFEWKCDPLTWISHDAL